MHNKSVLLPAALALVATYAAGGQANAQEAERANVTPAQLVGTWKGSQCENAPWSEISRRRAFVFTESMWKIIVHVYGDKSCSPSMLLFTADFGGNYEMGANSRAVPGAQETRFAFDHKLVTPTASGMDFLKPRCAQYPWVADTVQDIGTEGCGKMFVSIPSCPAEYDLTAITDGGLQLGDRSHSLCTPDARPTKLQALVFVKE